MTVNLLDVNYYRQANSDLTNLTNEQLVDHFLTTGINENRSFSRLVDLSFYRASNPDIASFSNAELSSHLSNSGVQEGRRFSQFVDLNFYGLANPDLASLNNEQRFDHINSFGLNEGRIFSQFVDLNFYRFANSDIAALNNTQIFDHLRNNGLREGRQFSQFVNLDLYKFLNSDLTTLNNQALLEHLEITGLSENRQFSYTIDPNFYRSFNPDLSNLGLSNQGLLEHFEALGLKEGRVGSAIFNAPLYLANSPDLVQIGFNTPSQAIVHFEAFGYQENRIISNAGYNITQDPGNTLSTSAELGVILGRRIANLNQQLSNSDRDDIYQFTLATITNIEFSIKSIDGEVNAQLIYDSNNNGLIEAGESIFSSNTGSLVEFAKTLGVGSYYLTVSTPRTDSIINYTLTPSATTIKVSNPVEPGDTLTTALNLGTLNNATINLQDFVGVVDNSDIYRFYLNTISDVDVQINGLTGQDSVDAQLIFDQNNDGQIEIEYISFDTSTSSISLFGTLGIGSYYVRVQPSSSSSNTNYNINFSVATTSNLPTTSVDPGDSLQTALNLGILTENSVFSDFVGTADRTDIYRFNIINQPNTERNVRFNVDLLTESVNTILVYDANSNGQVDTTDLITNIGRSSSAFSSTERLVDGTYFLRVNSANFQTNTTYRLSLNLV
ncbi:hypothetical protein [Chroococcus sp. FPU101]|uniref:hypothetical protein n=1 Tax=Chroococcus sp. FPU101 TaxID=1974212 RepID=UPI001A8E8167|nr:hypothetical protein [Chroococcus sp. FPU101]GFE70941.1 hypothetical protein CFPU101_35510 [Chroococcus sp. FPU101]